MYNKSIAEETLKSLPKSCQLCAKILPTLCQNPANFVPKWCHNIPLDTYGIMVLGEFINSKTQNQKQEDLIIMKKEELEAKMAKIAELKDKAEEAERARERAEEAEDSAYRNLDAELFDLVESMVGKIGNISAPDYWDEHQRYITKKALEIAHDAELCNNSDLTVAEGELLAKHARRWELYRGVDAGEIINSYIESKDKADVLSIAQWLSKGGQAFANSMVQELTGDNSIFADAVYIARNSFKVREKIEDSEWDDEYEPSEFIRLTRGQN